MNLAYIPSPGFSTITIGHVTIRMYALMILLGIIAAVAITNKRWKRVGGDFDQVLDIAIVAVPCGIVGARLYHVITTPERFFGPNGNFADIFRIWQGGMGIWGGILLGALGAWAWCRHKHYPMALLADAVAPALLVAQAIGRLGNWFNQELYGAPTTLPWGLKLNPNAKGAIGTYEMCYDGKVCPSDTLFQPTFLYEMIWNLIGAALLVWLGKKFVNKLNAGCLFCCYVMWYTLGRTWIEYLRIDYAHEFLGVRINVWVSLVVFILGIVGFMMVQRFGQPTPLLSDKLFAVTRAEEKQRTEEEQEAARRQRERDNRKKEREQEQAEQQQSDESSDEPDSSASMGADADTDADAQTGADFAAAAGDAVAADASTSADTESATESVTESATEAVAESEGEAASGAAGDAADGR